MYNIPQGGPMSQRLQRQIPSLEIKTQMFMNNTGTKFFVS